MLEGVAVSEFTALLAGPIFSIAVASYLLVMMNSTLKQVVAILSELRDAIRALEVAAREGNRRGDDRVA